MKKLLVALAATALAAGGVATAAPAYAGTPRFACQPHPHLAEQTVSSANPSSLVTFTYGDAADGGTPTFPAPSDSDCDLMAQRDGWDFTVSDSVSGQSFDWKPGSYTTAPQSVPLTLAPGDWLITEDAPFKPVSTYAYILGATQTRLTVSARSKSAYTVSGRVTRFDGTSNVPWWGKSATLQLQQKLNSGAWHNFNYQLVASDGTFSTVLNSNHGEDFRAVTERAVTSEGDTSTSVTVSVARYSSSKDSFGGISTNRSGAYVTVKGTLSYADIWTYSGNMVTTSTQGTPQVHVLLQRYVNNKWVTNATVLTSTTGSLSHKAKDPKSKWRWYYPGSSTYAKATSATFTK